METIGAFYRDISGKYPAQSIQVPDSSKAGAV